MFQFLGQSGEGFLLFKRNRIYYYRIWVPLELREHFNGKADIRKSLKTKNLLAAKTAGAAFCNVMESLFAGIRLGMLSDEDIKRIRSKIIGEVTEDIHSKINSFANDETPLSEYGSRWLRYHLT